MTDKIAFKAMCKEYGVDIIPDYTLDDVREKTVSFPVFVKPVDSRGSRGQTICNSYEELDKAIEFAQAESSNSGVLIEKYMEKVNEFHVTYFFVDGEPYLVRGSDNYCGPKETGMDKVVSCAVYPSRFLSEYIAGPHKNVVNMFKNCGIKYGPVFMQGFRDGKKFRFFDPGIRFPGVDCEVVIKQATGINYMKAMIDIALTGKCEIPNAAECYKLNDKIASVLYLNVRPGTIKSIVNDDYIKENPSVAAYLPRCKKGDEISWSYNVNQRFAEIDILADTFDELVATMDMIQKKIYVEDEAGENMIFNLFDLSRIER
jgi:biotin carboxylase